MVDLCRRVQNERFEAMTNVFEHQQKGTKVYMVIRGLARALRRKYDETSNTRKLQFEADLRPGDVFGNQALEGITVREYTVVALSPLEVCGRRHGATTDAFVCLFIHKSTRREIGSASPRVSGAADVGAPPPSAFLA